LPNQPTNGDEMDSLGMPTTKQEYVDKVLSLSRIITDMGKTILSKDKQIEEQRGQILKLKRKVARKNLELKKERTLK
jgi:hypothetical protein